MNQMHADPTTGDDDSTAQLIADSANRLFAEQVDKDLRLRAEAGALDATLWQQVCDSGFHRLLATEASGGFAQPWLAAYPLLRGLGYWQVPLPLAETMLAQLLGSVAGLPLPEGPLTLLEQGQGNDLRAQGTGADLRLSGTAQAVPWARHAQAALVSLADGRLAVLALKHGGSDPAAGVQIQPQHNHAGLPADTLLLQQAQVLSVAACPWALVQPVWTLGAVARSAMLVGALESALEQAVRYAGERVQFGKPIGKNQAIQQQLALMAGDVCAARVAALLAAADAPDARHAEGSAKVPAGVSATRFSTAVAKVRAGEAATRGAGIAHQVHGAIGFTHEHALHFATRRLWAWREEFGSDTQWATELGRSAIAARSAGLWPGITQRAFA